MDKSWIVIQYNLVINSDEFKLVDLNKKSWAIPRQTNTVL